MKKLIYVIFAAIAAFVLVACAGEASFTSGGTGRGTFSYPLDWSNPAIPAAVQKIKVVLKQGGTIVKSVDFTRPTTPLSIPDVPAGDTTVEVFAYDGEATLLASGAADFTLREDTANTPEVAVEPIPGEVADQQYVMGGSVATDPEDADLVRITLPALINRHDGHVATGLTESNFIVLEDNIRKRPITVTPMEGSSSKADIPVVLDTTGSMSGAISGVQSSVTAFADAIAASGIDVRFAGIEFGDDMRTQFDFSSDVAAFKSWVSGLGANGGDDWPENPLDAIMVVANKTNWRPDAQPIILVITDAPAHSADSITSQTVSSVVSALAGRFVCHVVAPSAGTIAGLRSNGPGLRPQRGSAGMEYIDGLAPGTGGVWTAFPSDGVVDLTSLPIASTITQGYLIRFMSHKYDQDHVLRLIVHDGETLLADQTYNGHYKPIRR